MRFRSTFSGAVLALGACAAFTFCTRAAALPAEYSRLEYIQGTGTQWINTGYTPASNDTIEEEVEFTGVGQNQAFWCARTDGAKATFTFFWLTGGLRFDYNTKQTTIPLGTFTAATGTRYKVKADGTTGDVTITYDTANGTTNNTVFTYEPASFTVGGTLSVLASQMKGSTSPGNYGLYKFYSLAITKSDGTPAVNLVPAKRVSDGALGVYDTVRDVFKTNAGSGTFIGVPCAKAHWTNAGGDGAVSNPANWTVTDDEGETVAGALPTADTPIVFSGNFAVQITTNDTINFERVMFENNATLTANCDWRGLGSDPKFTGSLDLAGFKLTVAGLTGNANIGSTAGNLLTNPGFEQDIINGGEYKAMTPSGWTSSGTVGVFKNHNGYGADVKNGSTWCRTACNAYVQQVVVINQPATYKLSFNFAASDDGGSYVNSYYYVNLDGAALTGNTRTGGTSSKSYSKTFTLAAGSHTIRIGCPNVYSNHAVNFDNISLVNTTLNKTSAGAGILEVDVPEGETVTNTGITFSGSVMMNVHKIGKGKLVMSKTGHTSFGARFATSLVVKEGIVDKTAGSATCGAQYANIIVEDGGQLLIGGKGYWDYNYEIAGAGPDGRGAIVNDTNVSSPWTHSTSYGYLRAVKLAGDATIGGSQSWGMQFYNYGAQTMTMNGRTVTFAGTVLYAGNLSYSGPGRIVIANDATVEYYDTTPAAGECELVVHGVLQQHNNALSPVKSLIFAEDGKFTNAWDSRPLFVVRDTYAPNVGHLDNSKVPHPTVQLGASGFEQTTLDISLFTNAFDSATTTFFAGSEVTVETGERELENDEKLVAWEAVPENVAFKPSETIVSRYALSVREDGLYAVVLDADKPLTAVWTGNGEEGNLNDPLNWTCYNNENEEISGALPTNFTTVVVSGSTKFSVPEGAEHPPWKEVRMFPERTTTTQWGRIAYAGERNNGSDIPGVAWKDMGLFEYSQKGAGNLANLVGKDTTWSKNNLNNSQLRFDGWFFVTPEQSGLWRIRQKFDDYFAFRIDGSWVAVNNTYQTEMTFNASVAEGWHRFTIVCGDTWGGQGGILSPGNVPMLISIEGGSEIPFTTASFTMGTEQSETLTLAADCDWTALGEIALNNAATLDLNGHNLTVAGLSAGDYLGATVVNNSGTLSTLTITNAAGMVALDGVAVKGNIAIVKKGEGAMRATPGSAYTGGLDVQCGVVTSAYRGDNPLGLMNTSDDSDVVRLGTNAVLELNGKYDLTGHKFILAGGELKNTSVDTGDGSAQIANLLLEADSKWTVAMSGGIIQSGHNKATLDLGGHTLTVPITSGKTFWLHNADVLNGLVDITSGGWLKVNKTSCRATTADFRINCALNMDVPMDVRDYIAVYGSNANEGTGVINVHGRFVPSETHDYFRGCVMQNGSTIDLGARTTALNATSPFTKGANTLGFAAGATVTVDLSKRPDALREFAKSAEPFVIVWSAAPDATVKFKPDAATRSKGYKLKPRTIEVAVEGSETPVEKSGLALFNAGGSVLIIR